MVMNIKIAAVNTLEILNNVHHVLADERSVYGNTAEHAKWMLCGIVQDYITGEKAHRWLGYAQGLLVAQGLLTLGQAKECNSG